MKISFANYCRRELLARKPGASRIISSVVIGFFAGVAGSYLLQNKLWLLPIAVLGIAGILVCLGGATGIFLNLSKVDQARAAPIKENVRRTTSQWDYRPRKPIRAPAIFGGPSAEASVVLSPDPFVINNIWLSGDSLEGAANTFMKLDPTLEDATAKAPLPG